MKIIAATLKLIDDFTPTLRRVTQAIDEQQKVNNRMARSVRSTGRAISGIGESMLPAAVAITGFGAVAVKAFADFEEAANKVQVKLDKSEWGMMDELKQQALDLSKEYRQSSTDILSVQEGLAAAGLKANQVLSATQGVLNGIDASGSSAEVVTSLVTNTMMAFGIQADHVNDIIDQLTVTANATDTSIDLMADSLKYASSAAATMGVPLADVNTLIGELANMGIKGSEAGTGIKDMLTRMMLPEHIQELQAIGVTVVDNNGKFQGMEKTIQQLSTAFAGMSDAQKMATTHEIFGDTASPAALAIIGQGADAYKNLNEQIKNSKGAAQDAADVLNSGLLAQIQRLKNDVNAFLVNLGGRQLPIISAVRNEIEYLVNSFGKLSDKQVDMIINIAGFVVGLTAFFLIGGKMITMLGSFGLAVNGMAVAIVKAGGIIPLITSKLSAIGGVLKTVGMAGKLLFANPFMLAIIAIIAVIYLLYTNWDRVSKFLNENFGALKIVISIAILHIQSAFSGLGTRIMGVVNKIVMYFKQFTTAAGDNSTKIGKIISLLVLDFKTQFAIIKAVVQAVLSVIVIIFSTALSVIGTVINGIITVISGIIDFIVGVFTGNWALAWQGVVEIFSGIFGTIAGICETILGSVKEIINAIIGSINSISVDIPDWVPHFGGQHYQPSIPMLAAGTDNWPGGMAMIHDAGAEVVNLPQGTQVIPHDKSLKSEYERGKKDGGQASINIAKIADSVIIREDADIDKIAKQIVDKIQSYAMNSAKGAI